MSDTYIVYLAPEPGHISRSKHAQRENNAGKISIHQSLVVNFLATDRLDGENVRAGFRAEFKRSLQAFPPGPGSQLGRRHLIASIGGGEAQGTGQMMLFVAFCQSPLHKTREFV